MDSELHPLNSELEDTSFLRPFEASRQLQSRRRFLWSSLVAATATIVPSVAAGCIESIQDQLEKIRKECDAIMKRTERNAIVSEGEDPFAEYFDWIDRKVHELTQRREDRTWGDPRFMKGDFDLDVIQRDREERWVGRCGGFARHFITSAAEAGFDDVRMYYAAVPNEEGSNPLGMHFYGVVGWQKYYWILNYGEWNFTASMVKNPDTANVGFRVRRECFRCLRPKNLHSEETSSSRVPAVRSTTSTTPPTSGQ